MKSMFKNKILYLSLIVGLLASCSDSTEIDDDSISEDIVLNPLSRATADKLQDFYTILTRDMGDYVDENSDSKNFVVSPLSVSMVMAMMANAVEGDLQQEIMDYLGVENLEGLNELSSTLLEVLPVIDRKTTLRMANSVWVNNHYELNTEFSGLMSNSYKSDINYFDPYDAASGTNAINRWCASKTDNRITNYISENKINSDLLALLLNAMTFKSEWRIREFFKESDTEEKPFYGEKGETEVPTMRSKREALYCYFDDDYIYTSIPFGNAAYRLEIVLPEEGKDVRDISRKLVGNMKEIRNSAEQYGSVALELPKFSVNSKVALNETLKDGGLVDLSKVAPLSLFTQETEGLINFEQQAMFEVDEKGAKAVAVTSGEILVTSPAPSQPVEINVNRPFIFFVTERSTGACLLSGRITDL